MIDSSDAAATQLRHSFTLRLVTSVAGILSTFALMATALRVLSHRDSALMLALLAAIPIGTWLGRLGIGPAMIPQLARATNRDDARHIVGANLRATLILSIVTAPIISAIAALGAIGTMSTYLTLIALMTLLITAETLRLTFSDTFAAHGRVRASVLTTHYLRTALALPLVLVLVFVLDVREVGAIVAAYLAAALVHLIGTLIVGRSEFVLQSVAGSIPVWPTIREGLILAPAELAGWLPLPATIWLAAGMLPPTHAAEYATAASLALQATLIDGIAAVAVVPAISHLWVRGHQRSAAELLAAIETLVTAVSVLGIVVVFVAGKFLLAFIYGDGLVGAYAPLLILLVATLAQTAFGQNRILLIAAGQRRPIAKAALGLLAVEIPAILLGAFEFDKIGLSVIAGALTVMISLSWWLAAGRILGPTLLGDETPVTPRAALYAVPRATWRLGGAWSVIMQREADPEPEHGTR